MELPVEISFDNVTVKEAGALALELQSEIKAATGQELRILKKDSDTQDFGASLVLILGTPAAVAIVNAIRDYLIKKNSKTLKVVCNDTTISGEGLNSYDLKLLLDKAKEMNKK